MSKRKEKKKDGKGSYLGIALLMLAGIGILSYPAVSNLWNEYRNSKLAVDYTKQVGKLNDTEKDAMYEKAVAYNKAHTVNTIVYDEKKDPKAHKAYEEILNTGKGIMGTLTIPKIHQQLVIYHGLGDEALAEGCGHMEGSSFPVGGESTHAAYAAHRGLPSAKLFTDLDKVKKGDVFYFFVLGHHLAYEVDQIKVVLPGDVEHLQIEEGKDLATLITCTPYAVNTHRLLVRGHRVPYTEKQIQEETKKVEKDLTLQIVLAGAITAGIILLMICLFGKKKTGKKGNKATTETKGK